MQVLRMIINFTYWQVLVPQSPQVDWLPNGVTASINLLLLVASHAANLAGAPDYFRDGAFDNTVRGFHGVLPRTVFISLVAIVRAWFRNYSPKKKSADVAISAADIPAAITIPFPDGWLVSFLSAWGGSFRSRVPWLPVFPSGAKSDTGSQTVFDSQWHLDTAAGGWGADSPPTCRRFYRVDGRKNEDS